MHCKHLRDWGIADERDKKDKKIKNDSRVNKQQRLQSIDLRKYWYFKLFLLNYLLKWWNYLKLVQT